MELREVTTEEREMMLRMGVFDINGNIYAHPGYTGIHQHKDGVYYYYGSLITDEEVIHAIEHRHDPKPVIKVLRMIVNWFRERS